MNKKSKKLVSIALAGSLSFGAMPIINITHAMNKHQLINVLQYIKDPKTIRLFKLVSKKCDCVTKTIKTNPFIKISNENQIGIFENLETIRIIEHNGDEKFAKLSEGAKLIANGQIKQWHYLPGSFSTKIIKQKIKKNRANAQVTIISPRKIVVRMPNTVPTGPNPNDIAVKPCIYEFEFDSKKPYDFIDFAKFIIKNKNNFGTPHL